MRKGGTGQLRTLAPLRSFDTGPSNSRSASRRMHLVDFLVQVDRRSGTAVVQVCDCIDQIGDRFFRVGEGQRRRAAFSSARAVRASTVRPAAYDRSAVSRPASSSGVSRGPLSSTAATTYCPAGRSRISAGRSLPFQCTILVRATLLFYARRVSKSASRRNRSAQTSAGAVLRTTTSPAANYEKQN